MKKKIFGVLGLLMTMVACAGVFSACGASRNDLRLESESQSIELVLGDVEKESAEVEVNIVGFGDGISGVVGFEVVGECARVESVTTGADKSRASCVLKAIRSGNSTLRATLYDGGASLNIPIRVEQKVVSMTAKSEYNPYVVKGAGKVVFDAEKLINFNPISTTQRDVYFMIGSEISDGFEASIDDTRESVEVDAVSVANENVRTKFVLRLIDPITGISTKVGGEEKSEVVLAVNSQTMNTAQVEIQMTSEEEELVCLNGFYTGEDYTIRMTGSTHMGDLHTFAFEVSGLAGGKSGAYEFKFGVGEEYDYYVSSKIDISTMVIAKNIAIGLETENYSKLGVFNYNSTNSRGTSFAFSVLPNNVNALQSWGTIIYDANYITIYNSTKNVVNSGDKIQSGSTLYVKGKSGALGETSIKFIVDEIDGVSDGVEALVPVVVHEGAKEIVGDSSIVLKLASDGSASDDIYLYRFDVSPSGAYSGDVWVEAKSTIIAIQKEENSNVIKIKALSTGATKIVMTLGNGVTKTIDVEVICELDEDSLVVDAPSSTQSEFVGEKTPVVVSRAQPLEKIVIQKSRAYEKAVPLDISFYPQNASISNIDYVVTKISGDKDKIVEIVNNSLVGKNEGKAKVEVTVIYDKLVDGAKVECSQKFEFEVEVYVAVTNFYFSDTTVTVADINSVGFYCKNEATKKIQAHFSPLDATNREIFYRLSDSDEEPKNTGILENARIKFNIDTGEITGKLEDLTSFETQIIATLVDYQRSWTVTIDVNVETYEVVRSIVFDNVSQAAEIVLSAGHPSFQILAHAENVTADNQTLIYTFYPNDGTPEDLISVDQTGLVQLNVNYATMDGLGGKIRVSAQDSFKNDNINGETYRDIGVSVAIGTKDSPYPITTAEELLALNGVEALAKYYKIVGVIDLKNKPISPLGELSGGIEGTAGSRIIGINLTGDDEGLVGLFSKISYGAYIKNVAFAGAINYEGDAQNVGLVAGVNNGTIENCAVSISKSAITLSHDAFVGGMFGDNLGTISTIINEIGINYNLLEFDGQMTVTAVGEAEVYVGGVVGKNSTGSKILRQISGVSLYGTNGYTANVDLITINAGATGGIVGLNDGSMLSLASCGKIVGGENVGGFVGVNNGTIGLDDDADNKARCISNTFVQGGDGVGGFVGYMGGGTITNCGVEIYEQSSYLENERYVAFASGDVGGFVGVAYAGNISQCYVASFRTGTEALVCLDSQNSNAQASAFVGGSEGGTISGCYSNITATKLSLGGIDQKVYDADVAVMPSVPTSVGVLVLRNEMTDEDGNGNVVYLEFYEAQIQEYQSAFDDVNKIKLGDFIDHDLGDAGAEILSSDSSIIKVESDGLKILARGLCQLTITSRFNPYLKESVYVWVVGVNDGVEFSQTIDDMSYSIAEGATIVVRADELSSYDKESTNIVEEGVQTVEGSSYDVVVDLDANFEVRNYDKLFTIGLKQAYIDQIKAGNVTNFVQEVTFEGVYSLSIAGKKFVSKSFATKTIKVKVVAGISSLNFSSSEFEMCANNQLKIGFEFESALEDKEELYVSANRKVYINGQSVGSEKTKINEDGKTSGEFLIELVNKDFVGTLRLEFSDKYNTYQKVIVISVLSQNVEMVATRYIDSLPKTDVALASTSSLITPGKAGILLLDITPHYSDIDYVTITNADTNPFEIKFECVSPGDNYTYSKISGTTLCEGGIKIPKKLFTTDGKFQTIILKTMVVSQVADNQPLTLIIRTSDGYEGEVTLITKHSEKVEGAFEMRPNAKNGGEISLAKNLDYTLNINSVGFSADQVRVETTNRSAVTITKISDFVYNIHACDVGEKTTLKIYGEKEVDGMTVKTQEQTFVITIENFYVYEKVNFKNAIESSLTGEFDIVTAYAGIAKQLEIELINGINCEYDVSDGMVVYYLKEFEEKLNKNGTFSIGGWSNNEENDEFAKDDDSNVVYPQKEMSAENSKTTFEFKYTDGIVTYYAKMKMDVEIINTSSSMIPIEKAEDFVNMIEGNYYILLKDITLPSSFKPISTKIAGFDGNNKKITITGYKNDAETETNVDFGLFEEIGEDVIVQNVHVYFENFTSTIISNSLNFGFIAAVNNGVITNCFVEGGEAKIVVDENSATISSKKVGGIVAENYGYVTNSRVQISIFGAYGNVAGIAVVNSGVISSCFVKNTTIINNSSSTDVMTAGIVCENRASAKIFGCFVEGGEYANGKIYCDDTVSIRANSKVAAFVFQNSGQVQDSYANIFIKSGSIASGFVYENSSSGEISNAFSLCLLQTINNNFPFVAIDPVGLVDTTAGSFKSCYICKEINAIQTLSTQTAAGITCLEKMKEFAGAENFETFGLSSSIAPEKGVWALKSQDLSEYGYPRLISAENIISISKTSTSRDVDASTGAILYTYTNMPDGTAQNPFIVSNAKELEEVILSTTNSDWTCYSYIRLVANIDYEDSETGVELSGLHKVKFCGELDGNGLEISGLSINSQERVDSAGFFATIGTSVKVGVVKDLTLIPSQMNFPNSSKTGALAGTIVGSGVYNVSVEAANLNQVIIIKGQHFVGGLVGYVINSSIFKSQIINCSSELGANATALSQTSSEDDKNSSAIFLPTQTVVNINMAAIAGGLVGYLQGGSMTYCRSEASMVLGQIAGGLVGYVASAAKINRCTTVVYDDSFIRSSFVAGGIAGINFATISQTEVLGNATNYFRNASVAPVAVGGLVGMNSGSLIFSEQSDDENKSIISLDIDNIDINYVGGAVGIMRLGTIKNYAIESNLRGGVNVGGVVGRVYEKNAIGIKISSCRIGKVGSTDQSQLTTKFQVYGLAENIVGAVVGQLNLQGMQYESNICTQNVLFSRTWIYGDNATDKTYSDVVGDLKDIISIDYCDPESQQSET